MTGLPKPRASTLSSEKPAMTNPIAWLAPGSPGHDDYAPDWPIVLRLTGVRHLAR
jgi:hypothetical protein